MTTSPPIPRDLQKDKRETILIWLAFIFVQGVADAFVQNVADAGGYQLFRIVTLVINTALMVYWFVLDARQREFKLSRKWIFGLVAIALLTAPAYFFRTRGKRFWRPLLLGLGILFAGGFCFALGSSLAAQLGYPTPGAF